MSAPFLTTTVPNMLIAVEVAWGADLTDLTGASWTWDDITADVIIERGGGAGGGSGKGGGRAGDAAGGSISITLGRPDFSQETQTAEMVCQLDNRSGAYSGGGSSPHWPYVRRNTPVRVRVSNDGGTTWFTRFQGAANGFTPRWDALTGRWATVTLSASGPLRRLNQGTGVGISAMREGTLSDSSVKAYWPCEDRQHSTFIVAAVGPTNGQFRIFDPATGTHVDGAPGECASYTDIPSSGPLVTLADGGGLNCTAVNATTTALTVSALFGNVTNVVPYDGTTINKEGFATTGVILEVYTPTAASVKVWEIAYDGMGGAGTPPTATPGRLKLRGYPETAHAFNTNTVFSAGMNFGLRDNTPYTIGLMLSQSGSTTTWQVYVRRVGDTTTLRATNTRSSNSNGAVVDSLQVGGHEDAGGLSAGHVVVRNIAPIGLGEFNNDEEWMNGYQGEATNDRLTRLCTTHGIPVNILDSAVAENASITDTMGPQYYDTLTALLREIEFTGQGVLYDGLGLGLTYVTKRRREGHANGAASLTIDAAQAQLMEPFAPVDDDQLTINHVDVTRRGGTTQVFEDVTGPMGIDAVGDYATSYTVNTNTDTGLARYAQWTVGVGTQEGYRYPSVSFALETNPSLIAGWLACIPQSRIDVTNVTAVRRQHPAETIQLLLEGWHEEIDAFSWRVTANTSQAAPWNVVVLAAETGSTGDGICHMDTDDSQLNASVAEGVTSISVRTNSGPLWVTSAADADSFPFDIDIGGIKATVTAISGATSPQTFTLSTPLPRAFTGSSTPGAGTPVKVWRPPVFGL